MRRHHPICFTFLVAAFLISAAVPADETLPFPFAPKTPSEAEQEAIDGHPLGSRANPVRCHEPRGQREYLQRLRCADGSSPGYDRIGSYGLGPYGTILDGYEVICPGDTKSPRVYMDMYHEGYVETEPAEGFTIVPPLPRLKAPKILDSPNDAKDG